MTKQNHKPTSRLCPRELFRVADDVKHLDAEQVRRFEVAFDEWRKEARRSDSVRSRERLRLTFLLLRHSGARLGEILGLDDRTVFDFERCVVHLGREDARREVPLPETFCEELGELLESPMGYSLRGEFFHIDPGYLRRVCYARGKECGLPRDLANPRVLRNTRAVEMLRTGVPLPVVKEVLGHSSLDPAAGLQQFTQGDVTSIVRIAQADMRKKTSARNSFIGHVTRVVTETVMAEVVMQTGSGVEICSIITMESLRSLRIEPGTPVIATIKAPLVNVLRNSGNPIGSARNRLAATVLRVAESPVIAEITGRLEDGSEVCALVSATTARELNLQSGDTAEFWFKGFSVVLNTMQS